MSSTVKEGLKRALARMLKPLVRLMIAQGVTHAEFAETAKEVYVETALRHFEEKGKVNRSRVAILTGLTRKEVKNVVDRTLEGGGPERSYSRPERVLSGWYSDPAYTGPYGIPIDLPYEAVSDGGKSFVNLVKQYSGDMAPRQMLNELLQSGSVVEVDGKYKAVRRNYKLSELSPQFLERLGDVGYRVFSTAAKNIDKQADGSGYFDRMVYADEGAPDSVIKEFDEYIKVRGQALLEEIDVWFSRKNKKAKPTNERKQTGLYMVHYVENESEKSTLRDLLMERGLDPE